MFVRLEKMNLLLQKCLPCKKLSISFSVSFPINTKFGEKKRQLPMCTHDILCTLMADLISLKKGTFRRGLEQEGEGSFRFNSPGGPFFRSNVKELSRDSMNYQRCYNSTGTESPNRCSYADRRSNVMGCRRNRTDERKTPYSRPCKLKASSSDEVVSFISVQMKEMKALLDEISRSETPPKENGKRNLSHPHKPSGIPIVNLARELSLKFPRLSHKQVKHVASVIWPTLTSGEKAKYIHMAREVRTAQYGS